MTSANITMANTITVSEKSHKFSKKSKKFDLDHSHWNVVHVCRGKEIRRDSNGSHD